MEQTLQAPASRFIPQPEVGADVGMEEDTRKRKWTEARSKWRIAATTIIAVNKFRLVLDVEAEKPEHALRELAAAFETLEFHPSSKKSVDGCITRNQGLCRTYPEAAGELPPLPNSSNLASSSQNQGYSTTGLKDGIASSDEFFSDAEESPLKNLREWAKECEGWSPSSLDTLFKEPEEYLVDESFKEPEEYLVDESFEYPWSSATGLMPERDNAMQSSPKTNSSDFIMSDSFTSDIPAAKMDSESSVFTKQDDDGMESARYEQPESNFPDPPVSSFLMTPDIPAAKMDSEGSAFIKEGDDGTESARYEQERQGSSEWSLESLWNIEESSGDWRSLAKEMNYEITYKIEDLQKGSGFAKVYKLVEDAHEITKKMGTPRSTSEGNKFRNVDKKATTNTLPSVRDAEQYLSDIFDKMESHIRDLSQNLHGKQRQLSSLQSMDKLIQNGRKALSILGRYTNTISEKLNKLVKDLEFRNDVVQKHLNKCAASITTLVQSALDKQKSNFTSVASVKKWYSNEWSSRQNQTEFFSPFASEHYPFIPVR